MDLFVIKRTELDGAIVNSVNSRDIYEYLELAEGKHNRWFQACVDKYGFMKNADYIPMDMDVSGNGVIEKAYLVTIDMAKELCMISPTKRGKKTRQYFIAAEKQNQIPLNTSNEVLNAVVAMQLKADKDAEESRRRANLLAQEQEEARRRADLLEIKQEELASTTSEALNNVVSTVEILEGTINRLLNNGQQTMHVKEFLAIAFNSCITSKEFNKRMHNNSVFDNTKNSYKQNLPNKDFRKWFSRIAEYKTNSPDLYHVTKIVTEHALDLKTFIEKKGII